MSHSRVPDTYLDAYYGFWFKDGLTMRDILPKVGNKQKKYSFNCKRFQVKATISYQICLNYQGSKGIRQWPIN